jgi:hypothetical protein
MRFLAMRVVTFLCGLYYHGAILITEETRLWCAAMACGPVWPEVPDAQALLKQV